MEKESIVPQAQVDPQLYPAENQQCSSHNNQASLNNPFALQSKICPEYSCLPCDFDDW